MVSDSDGVTCPDCGADLPLDLELSFCVQCGNRLEEELVSAVEELLYEERREVSVLFADLDGFSDYSPGRDPREVLSTTRELLGEFLDIVESEGGTVDKFMGDALMALFGAPEAHEDDPVRAISAGLGICTELERFNESLPKSSRLTVRVGINTGEVVYGEMPDGKKTVVGDNVNLAQRIKQVAHPNTVRISETTRNRATDRYRFEEFPPVRMKGKEDPVTSYEVITRKRKDTFLKDVPQIESRMVGRETELDELNSRFQKMKTSGQPVFVWITGPAGVGKSRLVFEWTRDLEDRDESVSIQKGRCPSTGHTSFGPLHEIVCRRANIVESEDLVSKRKKLSKMLETDLQKMDVSETELTNWTHLIGDAVGVPFPEEEKNVRHMDPEQQRTELFVALRTWIRAHARQGPVVWVFEDVHEIDRSTRGLVENLLEHFQEVEDVPFFLLLSARYEETGGKTRRVLGETNRIGRMHLEPLTGEETAEVVTSALGAPADATLLEFLADRAAGNPYFIEELLRYLLQEKHVEPARAEEGFEYRLKSPERAEEEVPTRARAVLAARIDRLRNRDQTVIKTGSVLGRSFWEQVVSDILEVGIDESLEVLQEREFIDEKGESRYFETVEYIFRHMLLRDVAYEQLLRRNRKRLHGYVADWLEENFDDPTHEIEALRAYNLEKSGEEQEAAAVYRRAGNLVRNTPLAGQAIDYFDRVFRITGSREDREALAEAAGEAGNIELALEEYRELLRELKRETPEEFEEVAEQIRIMRKTAKMLEYLGENTEANSMWELVFEEVPSDVVTCNCRELIRESIRIFIEYAFYLVNSRGAPDRSENYLEDAERMLENVELSREGEQSLKLQLFRSKGAVEYFQGRYEKARSFFQRGCDLAEQKDQRGQMATSLSNMAISEQKVGCYEEALIHLKKAYEIHENNGDRMRMGKVSGDIGETYQLQGTYEKAMPYLEKQLELGEEIGNKGEIGSSLNAMAYSHLQRGELEQSLSRYKQSLELAETMSQQSSVAIVSGNIGGVFHEMDRLKEAEEHVEKAIDIKERIGFPRGICISKWTLGLILSDAGDSGRALEILEEAREIAEPMEGEASRRFVAKTLFRIGMVQRRSGNTKSSIETLQKTLKMAEEVEIEREEMGQMHLELALDFIEMGKEGSAGEHLGYAARYLEGAESYFRQVEQNIARLKYEHRFENRETARRELKELVRELDGKKCHLRSRRLREWIEAN